MIGSEFGFLPEMRAYRGGGVVIEPVPEIEKRIATLTDLGEIHEDWFYPRSTSIPPIPPSPLIPPLRYSLPDTHVLTSSPGQSLPDGQLCDLFIAILGFFRGLRLVPVGHYHPARAATRIGQLVDFSCGSAQIDRVLGKVPSFRAAYGVDHSRRLFGAFHLYLFSRSYRHEFEEFNAQYIVLDSCWGLFRDALKAPGASGRVLHPERVRIMCGEFGMPVPAWARVSNGKSRLSELRNEFFHGGYFADEALGYGLPKENIVHELTRFNSRLLVALLGLDSDYIRLPVDYGMCFRVDDLQ